ncbi:MAG TPA: RluA family pseudouridine synthase [Polyangia bacterium]
MKKQVFRRSANDPAPLDRLLALRLGLPRADAVDLVVRGSVYVGSDRANDAAAEIPVGTKLTVHLTASSPTPPLVIVYRDDDLAVVDKPAGLPSQPERGQQAFSLDAAVARELGGEARPMHRLDKEVSGLVIVAIRPDARTRLQQTISEHESDRRYLAIVAGDAAGEGTIRKRIGRHPNDPRLRTALPERSTAGKPAMTHYRVLEHGALDDRAVAAVDVRLETGRTHQIRVHLASIAHPIVGDTTYGGPPFERLCLHAYALELPHPRHGRPLRVTAPIPDVFARLVPGLTTPFT